MEMETWMKVNLEKGWTDKRQRDRHIWHHAPETAPEHPIEWCLGRNVLVDVGTAGNYGSLERKSKSNCEALRAPAAIVHLNSAKAHKADSHSID